MKIELADTSHAEAIRNIYAPFVNGGLVTFETEVPETEIFEERISHYTEKYPWLVMVEDGIVTGYAYASAYRDRAAYQWVAECSVYVHELHRKKGIAAALYKTLFNLLALQGIYKVYAVITVPNPQSVGFHEKMGFKWFATYENVGFKANTWCNVGWWQLVLKEPNDQVPTAPIPFPELDASTVKEIISK